MIYLKDGADKETLLFLRVVLRNSLGFWFSYPESEEILKEVNLRLMDYIN